MSTVLNLMGQQLLKKMKYFQSLKISMSSSKVIIFLKLFQILHTVYLMLCESFECLAPLFFDL